MASLTCPNCGKDNPDFLDNCQFCQTALRREATLNIGEGPTKKSTGDLEPILPDWLRDARQQSRQSAEEESVKQATQPKLPKKEEPADLLAGLAFQSSSDEEDVPDWLAAINPVADKKTPKPVQPAGEEPSDFFAQFNQSAKEAPAPAANIPPAPDESMSWLRSGTEESSQKDEFASWLSQPTEQSSAAPAQDDWLNNLNAPAPSSTTSQPAEDLSWLHNLESSAQPPAAPETPQADMSWLSNMDSTSGSQEDLSWLNNLGGTPAAPETPGTPQEDLGWLNNLGGTPVSSQPESQAEDLSWLNNLGGTPAPTSQPEDLSWLNNLGGTPEPSQPSAPQQEDLSWLNNLGGTPAPASQPEPPPEDLSWLNNLGGTPAASQPATPQEDLSWLNNLGDTPASSEPTAPQQEDLSWLNNLGGTPIESTSQPAAPQEDLSWLNNLGGTPATSESSTSQQEDLSWLNNLGGTSVPTSASQPEAQPEDLSWLNNLGATPATPEPAASQPEDLSWLNSLGTPASTSQPESQAEDLGWLGDFSTSSVATSSSNEAQPSTPAESAPEDLGWLKNFGGEAALDKAVPAESPSAPNDLSWLNNLGGMPEPTEAESQPEQPGWLNDSRIDILPTTPLSPAHTAPLNPESAPVMPDWLKDAIETPSMPPLSPSLRDRFPAQQTPANVDQSADQTHPEPASVDQNLFASASDSSISNQDVDALFNVDMPDWLAQPAATDEAANTDQGVVTQSLLPPELSPVDLPSWVQAMRPVESVITETTAATVDLPTEQLGPLAGFRGLIPIAPIGSAQRPKALSLKLQATTEQQTSAALLEQIIASETTAHPVKASSIVAAQRTLRWTLTALFLIVLGVVVALGTQFLPVSGALPSSINGAVTAINAVPENSPVLIIMDYEPSLAGEMEAAAGPMLNQLSVSRHPTLTFISTSPSGTGLVDRLLTNTEVDVQSLNLGYLSGGVAGIKGFTENPKNILPGIQVNRFADFAAVIILTDHAESSQAWIEQISLAKQTDAVASTHPLLVVASAQAGPMLQPYVISNQVAGMVSGIAEAARYENLNAGQPGIVRSYWDAFGVGLLIAILAMVVGSIWSLITGIRARRAEAEQG